MTLPDRREFLRQLLFGSTTLCLGTSTLSAASRKPAPRFTRELRAINGRLQIDRTRWRMIVAHHSATRNGNAKNFGRYHESIGMENGLAYHFVIGNGVDSGDGEIEVGPRWLKQLQGGHVKSDYVNQIGIGICLVGNFQVTRPTKNQIAAFTELMDYLRVDVAAKRVKFKVHREVDGSRTVCPGRHFPTRQMHRRYG